MKKILILTHRLGYNYGGILQAFALQKYVEKLSADGSWLAYTTHRHEPASFKSRIRVSILRTIKSKKLFVSSALIDRFITSDTDRFVSSYIKTDEFKKLEKSASLYIVGSDQVWRASYVDPVSYMFGSVEDRGVKRISYAASFGTEDMHEYSPSEIEETAALAKRFDGVSTRELSGVDIIERNWGVKALHHVDPTLLLDAKDYVALTDDTAPSPGTLFVYVLDRSGMNNSIVDKVEKLTGTDKFELLPKDYSSLLSLLLDRKGHKMPKVEQWLRSFRDAEFVVTDSFHGTVFSIIFNKPFIAVGNKGRGIARFISLLDMFGLEHRLVTSAKEVSPELVAEKIDWALVNQKVKKEQKRSEEYLRKYIQ